MRLLSSGSSCPLTLKHDLALGMHLLSLGSNGPLTLKHGNRPLARIVPSKAYAQVLCFSDLVINPKP